MPMLKHFVGKCVPGANFDRPKVVQASPERYTNRPTMKKVLLILAVVMFAGMTLSSCSTHKACPAYGKLPPKTTERPA